MARVCNMISVGAPMKEEPLLISDGSLSLSLSLSYRAKYLVSDYKIHLPFVCFSRAKVYVTQRGAIRSRPVIGNMD